MTTYLLDTTVLVAHLRGESNVTDHLLDLVEAVTPLRLPR